ncbi:DUF4214 domain-containing protein [Sulfitobacter sp. JBTF-M27]|uniref:DUF4214 domain-containing protein n=1 Tax=Sulfitobacter sediminilitoris TaxID=2698830 RepID=A0A6P0CGI8_9RHOB|nr:DUF4214 domain-containing protein [Sulfitobacter sediminilitoris]NEK23583.1 DUF4214 domain-containing protein [Sulfitobacter sediminilitoris]
MDNSVIEQVELIAASEVTGLEILGTSGDDNLVGTSGSDLIDGGFGLDTISAGAGADTISGGSNYDEGAPALPGALGFGDSGEVIVLPGQPVELINGGGGTDTVLLSGPQSSYTLLLGTNGMTIVDRRAGGDGVDSLTNVEFLDFATELDVFAALPMDLDLFGRQPTVGADDLESIIELYIAYFNRAPDAIGLSFWADAFSNGTTLEEMASLFMQQDETSAIFSSSLSNGELVDIVYQNVLGRAPDEDGRTFWVDLLKASVVSQDQLILEIIAGAQAELYDDASQGFMDQQQIDRFYLSNKTDIGAYFAVHRGMSDIGNASAVMGLFDGSLTSQYAAVSEIDDLYASALDALDGEFLMPLVGVLDNPFDFG